MRTAVVILALVALAGCSDAGNGESATPVQEQAVAANTIECAIGGAAAYARDCSVEESDVDGTKVLVVRHPDGGFRRFELVSDGRGLEVAAGAEQAVTTIENGKLDVAVGADRYIFPATIRSRDRAE